MPAAKPRPANDESGVVSLDWHREDRARPAVSGTDYPKEETFFWEELVTLDELISASTAAYAAVAAANEHKPEQAPSKGQARTDRQSDDTKALEKTVVTDPITPRELDSRLEAVESRMETRMVELGARVDRLTDGVQALTTSVRESRATVETDIEATRKEVKDQNNLTRWTLAGLSLAVLALMATMQGTMTTANGNVLSALQAGLGMADRPAPVAPAPAPVAQTPTPKGSTPAVAPTTPGKSAGQAE